MIWAEKKSDADLNTILQTQLVSKLQNPADVIVGNESMFVLTILEKINKTGLKFSQGVTFFWKMANSEKAKVKLTNTQLLKSKSAAKARLQQH